MAVSDGALLRARGVEVKFGAKSYRLLYTFDALELLETEFDGLDNFIAGLSTWAKRYRTIRIALQVGLRPQVTGAELAELLNEHGDQLAGYLEAINEALSQSMGVELVDKDDDPKAEGNGASPGETSTTAPLSVWDDRTPSSGT